ncbi:hypothetical protein EDB80DRAFT_678326 [Ilyonectria destructans]|nr:hypothetical protein EDB80DRAFT_678326 [Ilyonectria destructans]
MPPGRCFKPTLHADDGPLSSNQLPPSTFAFSGARLLLQLVLQSQYHCIHTCETARPSVTSASYVSSRPSRAAQSASAGRSGDSPSTWADRTSHSWAKAGPDNAALPRHILPSARRRRTLRRLGCVPVRQRDEVQCTPSHRGIDVGCGKGRREPSWGTRCRATSGQGRPASATRDTANAQQDGGWTVEARARTVFWPDRGTIPSNHGAWFISRVCPFGYLIGICTADGRRSCYVDTFAGCIPPFCCFSPTRRPSGVGFCDDGNSTWGSCID